MLKKIIGLSILLIGISACGSKEEDRSKEILRKPVKTIIIEETELSKRIQGASSLRALEEVEHNSPGGEIINIYFQNGDKVEEGTTVIKLKNERIETTYNSAKAQYLSAKAQYQRAMDFSELEIRNSLIQANAAYINSKEQLNKALRGGSLEQKNIAQSTYDSAKVALEEASTSLEKNSILYEKRLISEDQFLRVQTAYNQAFSGYNQAKNNLNLVNRGADKEDINILEAGLRSAEGALQLAKKSVSKKTWEYNIEMAKAQYLAAKNHYILAKSAYEDLNVKAKIDGFIANLNNKTFDDIGDGDILFTVLNNTYMEAQVGISPQDLPYIKVGSTISSTSRDFSGTKIGHITEINPIANEGNRKFTVKGLIENPYGTLKSGMYANITINGIESRGIVIPKESIVIRGIYQYVFINNDGVAERILVELGSDYGSKVEVLNGVLNEGDSLVIEGQHLLENNDLVEEVK